MTDETSATTTTTRVEMKEEEEGGGQNGSTRRHDDGVPSRSPGGEEEGGESGSGSGSGYKQSVIYTVEDVPPWYLCLLLGFQHYLTAVGALVATPILLSEIFCMDQDTVGLAELIGTLFFASGLITLLQTTFGVRLPIVQGGTFTFFAPTIAIMSQKKFQCNYAIARAADGASVNFTEWGLPPVGSEGHREIWQTNIREIQGAIILASIFQVVIGFSGIMGLILRFIGPLAIVPTISLVGLSLFSAGSGNASGQWWIAIMTIVLITLFSQYLGNVEIPLPIYARGEGCKLYKLKFFSLFPVLLAMILAWIICAILTATDTLPDDPAKWGYLARTDIKLDVLDEAKWFRFPYPGQWGRPTFSVSSVFGMLAGVLASMVESVGDYYACARLSGAPPPPVHAVNRGIGMEGIGCMLAGAWGTGTGSTSYSENIGAIGITKVGSRRVVQVGGCILLFLGCLGKFGAIFATIPGPVVGGMFMVTFGMVTAVGLSNLQYVDLNSPRNIFILGLSLYFGLSLPNWMEHHPGVIDTGNEEIDQIFSVLMSTSMFVGGMVGFVLDNTIPGTDEERGIKQWRAIAEDRFKSTQTSSLQMYDIPFIQPYLNRVNLFRFIPFCPQFLSRTDGAEGSDNNEVKSPPPTFHNADEYLAYDNTAMTGSVDTKM